MHKHHLTSLENGCGNVSNTFSSASFLPVLGKILFVFSARSFLQILFKASLLLFPLQLQSYQFQTGVVLSNKLTFYANISMLKVKFILTLVLAAVVVVVVIVVLLLLTLA